MEKIVLDVVEESNLQKQQFSELLAAMRNIPQIGAEIRAVVQPQQPDANTVRADKVQRLTLASENQTRFVISKIQWNQTLKNG